MWVPQAAEQPETSTAPAITVMCADVCSLQYKASIAVGQVDGMVSSLPMCSELRCSYHNCCLGVSR
jgi:hypothetical protein